MDGAAEARASHHGIEEHCSRVEGGGKGPGGGNPVGHCEGCLLYTSPSPRD